MFEVIKRNERLWVINGDQDIYTPPDFVRPHIRSRRDLQALSDRMNQGEGRIEAILAFETSVRTPKRSKSADTAKRKSDIASATRLEAR